jgi:hypothetical protein
MRFFVVFLGPPLQMPEYYLKTDKDHFFPHSFTHKSSYQLSVTQAVKEVQSNEHYDRARGLIARSLGKSSFPYEVVMLWQSDTMHFQLLRTHDRVFLQRCSSNSFPSLVLAHTRQHRSI